MSIRERRAERARDRRAEQLPLVDKFLSVWCAMTHHQREEAMARVNNFNARQYNKKLEWR